MKKPLVDERLLYNSSVRDEDMIITSVCETSSYQIFVKGQNGKTLVLWTNTLDTVDEVKDKIAEKTGLPCTAQRLVFYGREMLGARSMSDYHMRKNNTLFLVMRLRGGGSVEERLDALEGCINEIELAYATDNYVDDRDNRLQDAIDRESAILATHIDDVHDRIDTMRTNDTMLINSLRDRMDEAGIAITMRDRMVTAELEEHSRKIEAIVAGRVLGALSVGGAGGVQETALAIAAIQTQNVVQQDVHNLREAVRCFRSVFSEQQNTIVDQCNLLRREVVRLNTVNTNTQAQLNTLEDRINRMTRRAGPYEEANPPPRPRRVLPATFGALRGGGLILVKTLSGKTITIDCSEAALVKFLAKKIRAKTGIPRAAEFYLIFRGRRMEDKIPLFQYGVGYGSTVWMVLRLRGGAKADPRCKKTTKTRAFQI